MSKRYTIEEYQKASRLKSKAVAKIMAGFFLIFIILSILQVLWLEVFHHYRNVNLIDRSNLMYENQTIDKASRGIITDAQGNKLAINVNTYDMYAILDPEYKSLDGQPFYVEDKEKTATELLNALGLSNNQAAVDLFNSQLNQDAKQVEFGSYGKNLTLDQKNQIDSLNLPGIKFNEVPTRYYPYGDFASYAVGYAKYDDNGVMVGELGVEKDLDGYLRGQDGEIIQQLDAHGIPIGNQEPITIHPKANGNNIELTIDANIQAVIQEEMNQALKDKKYDMAYTIMTDAKTGEILGMYSLPTFNPNIRDVTNYEDPFSQYCFEPGSTMKTFLVAEAMERGVWNPDNKTQTGTTTRSNWGGNYISDWVYNEHKTSWGRLEWSKGYFVSSNTVMLDILDQVGYSNWVDALENKWEFGKPVSTQFSESSACDVSPNQPLEIATTAFGQGMTSNGLQMLRAYSAIANDGVMTTPHLIKKIEDTTNNEIVYDSTQDNNLATKQVVSKDTADKVLELMRQVVTYKEPLAYRTGTGYIFKNSAVPIAAKTATAEIASGGSYSKEGDKISSYAILAPADDPQICMYSVLINPDTDDLQFYGDMISNIVTKSINYLTKHSNGIEITLDSNQYLVEDYLNQDIDVVTDTLNQNGINVISLGSGNVSAQYPLASQVISNDQSIILRGEGDVDPQIMVGLSVNQVQVICQLMGWQYQINGNGNVVSVTQAEDGGLIIECGLPPSVTNELNQRTQSS